MDIQEAKLTREEIIENITKKLGDRITEEEDWLLYTLSSDLNRLDVLKKTEKIIYGNEYREAFEKALEKAMKVTHTRNTSIEIKDSNELKDSFDVFIEPTNIKFLSNLFVFFGMNINNLK